MASPGRRTALGCGFDRANAEEVDLKGRRIRSRGGAEFQVGVSVVGLATAGRDVDIAKIESACEESVRETDRWSEGLVKDSARHHC